MGIRHGVLGKGCGVLDRGDCLGILVTEVPGQTETEFSVAGVSDFGVQVVVKLEAGLLETEDDFWEVKMAGCC